MATTTHAARRALPSVVEAITHAAKPTMSKQDRSRSAALIAQMQKLVFPDRPLPTKPSPVAQPPSQTRRSTRFHNLQIHPHPRAIKKQCPNPIATVTAAQLSALDPSGARTRLFAKANPEAAKVGDILLVRLRSGEPFAGVCINIRRRGVDTAVLLRGQLTRVGVEMWYKVYSPLVEGIEVVQRAARRARRARLTYMRTVKHDRGSVEGVVRVYLRQKAALGAADGAKRKGVGGGGVGGGTHKKGRGKKGR